MDQLLKAVTPTTYSATKAFSSPRQMLLDPGPQQQPAVPPRASVARALLTTIGGVLAAYGALMLLTNHAGLSSNALVPRAPIFAHAPSLAEGAAALAGGSDAEYRAAAVANITAFRRQLMREAWKSPVPKARQRWNRTQWQSFESIITCPSDRPLRTYGGTGDGSKLLCDLGARQLQRGCVIYSLGSKGNFKFESSMMNETDCEVHTFDCTYDGASIHPGRHFYHKLCIGSRPGSPEFKPYSEIVRSLGHANVDLLKMDIEGWEYAVFTEFQATDPLPIEISTELHILPRQPNGLGPSDKVSLSLLFLDLAHLGYGAYSMEVNPLAPNCCSEFSFMRFWPLA